MLVKIAAGTITQRFGHSALSIEPTMFASAERAYWLAVPGLPGLVRDDNFHPGLDVANAEGTPLKAQESGRVIFSGWRDAISGNQVEVQVNERFRYSANHLSRLAVRAGDLVHKGTSTIGLMGHTGLGVTGDHAHSGNSIYEPGPDLIWRTFLYDPELFLKGGKYADDDRIQPEDRSVVVHAIGANALLAPPHQPLGQPYARTMDPPRRKAGWFRRGTGNRIAPLDKAFPFLYWRHVPGYGRLAIVHGFGHRLAIRDEYVHFV